MLQYSSTSLENLPKPTVNMDDSKKFLRVSGLPSPGPDPAKSAREKEIRRRLVEGEPVQTEFTRSEDPPDKEDAETNDAGYEPRTVIVQPVKKAQNPEETLAEAMKWQDQNTTIEVLGPFGRISFKVMNVSVNEHGIAFIVHKDAMSYEPNVQTELKLKIADSVYDVVYVGGFFTFKHIPFNFLSFIRISEPSS